MKPRRHSLILLTLGVMAVIVYDYAFSQPYNLVVLLESSAPPDLGVVTGYARHAAAFYVGAVSLLVALYLASVHVASRVTSATSWRWALALGVGMALVLVRTYPYAASDLFLYVARGRVLGVYGFSSMALAPVQTSVRDYVPFWSEWLEMASPYGPLWEWVAALLARLGNGSALRSLLVFKLFNVICYAGTGWLIHDTLRLRGEANPLAGLVAFVWNPLLLLEGMANGHNDLLMIFFLAMALWCWQRRRHTEFLLAMVGSGLVKYIPFLLMPMALLALYRRVGWRRWLQTCLTAGGWSLLLLGATMVPLFPGWRQWSLGGQMRHGHNSVFTWLTLTLMRWQDRETAAQIASQLMRAMFIAGYVWMLIEAFRNRMSMVDQWYSVLLLYMIVGANAFGYWYIAWLCALVPLVRGYRQRLWTLALSWTGLMSVALYNFGGEWLASSRPGLNIHLLAVPFVFLIPFIVSPWVGEILPPALSTRSDGDAHLPATQRTL